MKHTPCIRWSTVRALTQNLRSGLRQLIRGALVLAAAATLTGIPTAAADPDAADTPATADPDRNFLWKTVHDRCEVGYQRSSAYAPCALVDEKAGTALYKDIVGPYQYLLLPLARITGIEDSALQEPTSHHYLQDAWAARTLVTSRLNNRLPESDIVLAINSQHSRTQDQLHIHISCASPATAAALKTVDAAEYGGWKPLSTQLNGQTYQALAVTADTLKSKNLFQDIYAKVIGDDRKMEDASVALVNLAPDQFLLLLIEGTENQRIQAESLQEHNCSLAHTG